MHQQAQFQLFEHSQLQNIASSDKFCEEFGRQSNLNYQSRTQNNDESLDLFSVAQKESERALWIQNVSSNLGCSPTTQDSNDHNEMKEKKERNSLQISQPLKDSHLPQDYNYQGMQQFGVSNHLIENDLRIWNQELNQSNDLSQQHLLIGHVMMDDEQLLNDEIFTPQSTIHYNIDGQPYQKQIDQQKAFDCGFNLQQNELRYNPDTEPSSNEDQNIFQDLSMKQLSNVTNGHHIIFESPIKQKDEYFAMFYQSQEISGSFESNLMQQLPVQDASSHFNQYNLNQIGGNNKDLIQEQIISERPQTQQIFKIERLQNITKVHNQNDSLQAQNKNNQQNVYNDHNLNIQTNSSIPKKGRPKSNTTLTSMSTSSKAIKKSSLRAQQSRILSQAQKFLKQKQMQLDREIALLKVKEELENNEFFSQHKRDRGTKPKGNDLLTKDLKVQDPKIMRSLFRHLLKLVRRDEKLQMMSPEQLRKIHKNFDKFYLCIMKKQDNLIMRARQNVSKEIVEKIFRCSLCRAVFDRYSEDLISKQNYKPYKSRSHPCQDKKPRVLKFKKQPKLREEQMVAPEDYDDFNLKKYESIVRYHQEYSKLFAKIDEPSKFHQP